MKQKTGFQVVDDAMLVAEASRTSGLAEKKIEGAFSAKTSIFNQFTHEKERSIAYLRLVLSKMLVTDNLIVTGASGLLIPHDISHALWVCVIADLKSRIAAAQKEKNISGKRSNPSDPEK
ncbi:MAG: hypothetical protein R2874_04660 [Desulfobacterales bacterium]